MKTRREKDSLGTVEVPEEAYWGAATQRAIENFPISGRPLPREYIAAMALFKKAAAEFNLEHERLEGAVAGAVIAAAQEVFEGSWDAQFPVDMFQTGSGTSFNMNMNEVIANVAGEKLGGKRGAVHPNDHVNKGQSSNDLFPSAAHLAVLMATDAHLRPGAGALHASLVRKAKEFDDIVKLGRTHLMDALPVRLGQVFSGYARQIEKAMEEVRQSAEGLCEIPLGGTAIGTGMHASPGYAGAICRRIGAWTGQPVFEARDHFEAQGARDDFVTFSAALERLACALTKIANDVRYMGSGPLGGFAEIRLKPLQPGSSMMPGKVNPVICESVVQVAAQVIGNHQTVVIGAQGGQFELNVMIPVMTVGLLDSLRILGAVCGVFAGKCIDGIEADADRCRDLAERSAMLATALVPLIGYDQAGEIAKEAVRLRKSVKQVALDRGVVTAEQAEEAFKLRPMTEPER